MRKVITYGSFDLFHYGHRRLLERAKALGDYLIVGVTSDDYDRIRGKVNVEQPLADRIAAVKATGLADKIIIEEYDGQKIDDIKRENIDVFAIGSDWEGKFDYLGNYCEVVYLERTKGVSSSEIRAEQRTLNFGLVGDYSTNYFKKIIKEVKVVNGLNLIGVCPEGVSVETIEGIKKFDKLDQMLAEVDAVYIKTSYEKRASFVREALKKGRHVLCEAPICLDEKECQELFDLAKEKKCILVDAIRTAFSTAYKRLALLAEIGKVGQVLSVDATCTNMIKNDPDRSASLYEWGPNALLPVFQILGTNYKDKTIISHFDDIGDAYTKINFIYDDAVASISVAEGAKSEGELVITGTKAYIYVPAPWWKTEYFELRYENSLYNRRYFYQLDGEGIRYELVEFVRAVKDKNDVSRIDREITLETCKIMREFKDNKNIIKI